MATSAKTKRKATVETPQGEQQSKKPELQREQRVNFDTLLLKANENKETPPAEPESLRQEGVEKNTTSILQGMDNWIRTRTVDDAALVQLIQEGKINTEAVGDAVIRQIHEFYSQCSGSPVEFEKTISALKYEQREYTSGQRLQDIQDLINQYSMARESNLDIAHRLSKFLYHAIESPRQYKAWIKGLIDEAGPRINDAHLQIAADRMTNDAERYLHKAYSAEIDTEPLPTHDVSIVGAEAARRTIGSSLYAD